MIKVINSIIYSLGLTFLSLILFIVGYLIIQKPLAYLDWTPAYKKGSCISLYEFKRPLLLQAKDIHHFSGLYEVAVFIPNRDNNSHNQTIDIKIDGFDLEEDSYLSSCDKIQKNSQI